VSALPAGVEAVLLDIEGTTTPIAFVTATLFPYVRVHLQAHLARHAASDDYAALVDRLRGEWHAAGDRGEAPPAWSDDPGDARLASAVAFVGWLMDQDRKSTPLKDLQGRIWQEGYERGELVSEVFPDVPPALGRWRERGVRAAIYSSGSVLGQQLLFRHTSSGDLTPLLDGFFDTNIGVKTDPESYRRIAPRLCHPHDGILFLSDAPRELEAARAAGMHVRLAVRPGNATVPEGHGFDAVFSFDEL
jgi:enolase-phosphatase E1